ncbi:pantoate--beta-alanine ligase [Acaricomes phytoseiuli]|uniref:pantoate--beta-alanine ligase n=1 Tax=Acaricomes phytoseiuli TaxID=291968 RepID=UPI00035E30D5|nr:pantoate--beta-alanine ligase [Acaricomes phytoseiuli]MCW1249233.1 pantoate--beta-alanine ligase [Acaricomes phytoseiuli]
MTIEIVRTVAELRELSAGLLHRAAERSPDPLSLGLVPTMGALHEGHASLAAAAAAESAVSIASVFVNPLQFGDVADLGRYPRTLDADAELLEAAGVDIVFAPAVAEMYPGGDPLIRIEAGELGGVLEGASRPGHFSGALTVVAKLLHYAMPSARYANGRGVEYRAYFGQKDAQQLLLVQRMVQDLNFPVQIIGVPTVRAQDGLALSSRNRFLSEEERRAALVLPRALGLLAERSRAGDALDLDSAAALVRSEPLVTLDYLEVVDPRTLVPLVPEARQGARPGSLALIAAQVGRVRLIDNMFLE